jgi:hypothetical protein
MNIPAHKDTKHPPGQWVNTEIKSMAIPKKLGDIIDKIKKEEELFLNGKKKLTFDEWFSLDTQWSEYVRGVAEAAWQAGQENK